MNSFGEVNNMNDCLIQKIDKWKQSTIKRMEERRGEGMYTTKKGHLL